MISAHVIADSIAPNGARITTFVGVFPRIVLAELNTHRAFSRNSASSRAIPYKKQREMVLTNPFIPTKFQKPHSGMQGTEYFEGADHDKCVELWLQARDHALAGTDAMDEFGITKQLSNRPLEAFQYHTVIITATDWANFFALRAHPAAEIHIAELAEKMLKAYNESSPNTLRSGEWHIPFGDKFETERLNNLFHADAGRFGTVEKLKVMIATARCARVSYLNFEGKDDYAADINLHDRLFKDGHFSPFEHCAMASSYIGYSGNFHGFTQYRKTLIGENKQDSRIILAPGQKY